MNPIVRRLGLCISFAGLYISFAAMPVILSAAASPVQRIEALPSPTPRPDAVDASDRRHDRFIVRWSEDADPGIRQRVLATAIGQVLPAAAAGAAPRVQLRSVRKQASGAHLLRTTRPLRDADAEMLVRALAADPAVVHVERDRMLRHTGHGSALAADPRRVAPALVPDDALYAQNQWHFFDPVGGINAPAAWDLATGTGTVVAVLDTGITGHEDLDDNLLQGYDFITDRFVSRRDTDARVPGAQDYGDWNDDPEQCPVTPSSWHGTHVSGTVAELTDNGIGMAGVAFDARVLPLRVLGRCGGYTSDIADAIVWASGGTVPGVPANTSPAEVINLSLSGIGACEAGSEMQQAIDEAVSRGSVVVAAAGNDNSEAMDYTPAGCANVITVGASRITAGKADYSNHGLRVDIAAPGGGGEIDGSQGFVFQNWLDAAPTTPDAGFPWYVGMAGTSMAAPHVSGVAALVQSAVAQPLTPAQMRELLKLTARPFPAPIPADTPIGAGIVDAEAALLEALNPCTTCDPPATPLRNGVPVTNLAGETGTTHVYALAVPAGIAHLRLMSYGGTGDVALWISHEAEPTASSADYRSSRLGNNEIVTIARPRYGTYYVKIVAEEAYSRVALQARY